MSSDVLVDSLVDVFYGCGARRSRQKLPLDVLCTIKERNRARVVSVQLQYVRERYSFLMTVRGVSRLGTVFLFLHDFHAKQPSIRIYNV